MWIFPWNKLSWHSCSVWDKLGCLNWFWQFLWGRLSSFNQKKFYNLYVWSCTYVKEGLSFAWGVSLENSVDLYLCFLLALLHWVSYFFLLYQLPSSSLCTVFYSISSNVDEVLSVNPSAVFVFGDFNVHHKDWLTYSGEIDRPGELRYNFSILNNITQIVNFPPQIPDCDSDCPAFFNFFLLTLVFILQWLSLIWEILTMLLFQFPSTFFQTQNRMSRFMV